MSIGLGYERGAPQVALSASPKRSLTSAYAGSSSNACIVAAFARSAATVNALANAQRFSLSVSC